jgi:glyoxalase/bleomycin resistance protein/dioxygenase superfamily protein
MSEGSGELGLTGVHAILFSAQPERTRVFLRDVLELPYVEVHEGWLIFALPPAEIAVHPADGAGHHELFLMCEDIDATVERLAQRGVETTGGVTEERWGLWTTIVMPDGSGLRVYQPSHPSPPRP